MKMLERGMGLGLLSLVPFLAFAQTPQSIGALVLTVFDSLIIPLIFTLALGAFTYGTFQYYIQGLHDDQIRQKSVALMVYGLVAFVVMALIWTAVHIFAGSLGF